MFLRTTAIFIPRNAVSWSMLQSSSELGRLILASSSALRHMGSAVRGGSAEVALRLITCGSAMAVTKMASRSMVMTRMYIGEVGEDELLVENAEAVVLVKVQDGMSVFKNV